MNLEDLHDCLVNLHYLSAATTISKFKNPFVLNMGKTLRDDVSKCRDFLHQFWALLNPNSTETIGQSVVANFLQLLMSKMVLKSASGVADLAATFLVDHYASLDVDLRK